MLLPVLNTDCCPSGRLLRPGHSNCGGCGLSVVLQLFWRFHGDAKVQLVVPACCAMVTAGGHPYSGYDVPLAGTTFASTAAVATGLSMISKLNDEPVVTVCIAGDGGTYDIGLSTLSAAAERNENLIYLCYDNEIYGNTGGQTSGATPTGASTSTSPRGKPELKKDIMSIMVAHHIPYAATLSIAHLDDFARKIRTAFQTKGFRFLLAHSPCPTGWKTEPAFTLQLVRDAVDSGLFPLYEVRDGERYTLNRIPTAPEALRRYLTMQGRFKQPAAVELALREQISHTWTRLEKLAR